MDFRGDIETNSGDYLPKKFCTQAFMVIVQEALNQLFILRKIYNWPEPSIKLEDFTYKSIEERYSKKVTKQEYKVESVDELVDVNLKVFQKNCIVAESVLVLLLQELNACDSFEQFREIVDGFIKMKKEDEELLQSAVEKENELRELSQTFEDERIGFFKKIEKCMSDIGKMKDSIEVSGEKYTRCFNTQ